MIRADRCQHGGTQGHGKEHPPVCLRMARGRLPGEAGAVKRDISLPTCSNYLKAGKERLLREPTIFHPSKACGVRNCCFYTGSLIPWARAIRPGRKYLKFTCEEASSQKLRKMNFHKMRR